MAADPQTKPTALGRWVRL